jgi:hypothetical protein
MKKWYMTPLEDRGCLICPALESITILDPSDTRYDKNLPDEIYLVRCDLTNNIFDLELLYGEFCQDIIDEMEKGEK